MNASTTLKPFQQAPFETLCQLSIAFHDCMTLQETEKELWEWLVTGLAPDDTHYVEPVDRANLILLYEQVKTAIIAVYGLTSKQETGPANKQEIQRLAEEEGIRPEDLLPGFISPQ